MSWSAWKELLDRAVGAPLPELIDPKVQVFGSLRDGLDQIEVGDMEALEKFGIPASVWLQPAIEGQQTLHTAEYRYRLTKDEDDRKNLLGVTDTTDPGGLFVLPSSGRVMDISRLRRDFVNRTLGGFVEMAWRYEAALPVLRAMQYEEDEDGPVASTEDEVAIKQTLWKLAIGLDPYVDVEPTISYWWQRIWDYS